MAANAEITARQLEIGYGETLVVSDLDIHIRKGEITTIIGPNGSGKSTVLKALTRLLKYRSGVVEVLDRDLKDYDTKELARLIGVLPQKHTAPPDFTVRDLVGYGRMPHQKWYERNSKEDDAIVDWALEVTGTSHLAKKSGPAPAASSSGCGLPWCWPSNRKFCFWTSLPPIWTSPISRRQCGW